jgi:glycosyltransferase involved in cell wall biosynthesis
MTVSIVTISFNQCAFLEEAMLSVLDQTGADIEYIVVDPGSTDGSRELIERYRDRIDHVILDPDAGPADGLNRGLAAATGEIFAYVNADDALEPGAVAEAVAAFADDPACGVVYGNGWVIDAEGRRVRRILSSARMTPNLYVREQVMIVQQASFIRTVALRGVGGFNVANRTCWDGEAFLQMARAGVRFKRVWRDWGLFRLYPGSISGGGQLFERYKGDMDRMFADVNGRPPAALEKKFRPAVRLMRQLLDPRALAIKIAHSLFNKGETR